MTEILFQNQTGNGDSPIVDLKEGGYGILKATGIFDGADITLNMDFKDNDFAPVVDDNSIKTLTVPGVVAFQPFKPGVRLKATIANAGVSTDITLKLL